MRTARSPEGALRAQSPGAVEVIEVSGDARGRGVADVLAEATGVQVQALGGLGQYAQVSIRGSSSQQVAVYLDGVPISQASGGAVNLADIPLAQLERIEVYRGLPPTWLPGAPAGGAVNLVTRAPAGRRRVEAEVGGGSLSGRSARALGQYARERLVLTSFADYQGSAGDFDYDDAGGTPLFDGDNRLGRRQSNGFDRFSLHTTGLGRLGRERTFRIGGGTVFADRQVPTPGSLNWTTGASLQTRRAQVSADLTGPAGGLGLDFSFQGERFEDPEGRIGPPTPKDVDGRTLSAGVRRTRTYRPASQVAGTLVADTLVALRYDRYDERDLLTETTSDPSSRLTADATLSVAGRPGGGSLIVTPEVRASAQRDAFAGRAGEGRLLTSQSLRLASGPVHLTVWSGRRSPSFFELFGDRGSVVGNDDLEPERVLGVELGVRGSTASADRRHRLSAEAVGFSKRASDLIQFRQASLQTSRAFNVGEADIHGVELRTRVRLTRRFDLVANYTWQRATDAGDVPHTFNRRLPRTADHELFVRPRLRLLEDGLVIAPRVAFNSAMVLDPANLHRVPARTLVGLEIDVALPLQMTLGLTGENLLDERTQDFQGFPLPGRTLFVTLGWRWIGGPAS